MTEERHPAEGLEFDHVPDVGNMVREAIVALDDMEANEYWRRGDYSENIETIRIA